MAAIPRRLSPWAGRAYPLGATWDGEGVNFDDVSIVIKPADPIHAVEADVKTGGSKGLCRVRVAMRAGFFTRVAPLDQIVVGIR